MSDIAASPAELKAELRRQMQAALSGLPRESSRLAGQAICERLASAVDWQQADSVALFASLAREVDTDPVAALARAHGKRTLFPRMTATGSLDFVPVDAPGDLIPGRFGVLEPSPLIPAIPLDSSVLVLVPGLAFDRSGGRLGRGGGYYDRALAQAGDGARPGRRLGLGFSLQIVDCVAMQPHDVRLDGVVTENEWVRVP